MQTNPYNLTNGDCARIVQKLDNDLSLDLTDWEAEFIESNLHRNHFSEKQKEVLAKITDKYNVSY